MENPDRTTTVKGRPPQSELNLSLYRLSSEYSGLVCKRGDIVLRHKHDGGVSPRSEEDYEGNTSADSEESVFAADKHEYIDSGCVFPEDTHEYTDSDICVFPRDKHEYTGSERCVLPRDKQQYNVTEGRVFPNDKYEYTNSKGCDFPGDKRKYTDKQQCIVTEGFISPGENYGYTNSEGCVFPGDKFEYTNSEGFSGDKHKYSGTNGCVFPGDRHKYTVTEGHVIPGDRHKNTDTKGCVIPGEKHKYIDTEGHVFPGDKYVVQAPDSGVVGSAFADLWDASTSDVDDHDMDESVSHLWMNESGSTDSCLADGHHESRSVGSCLADGRHLFRSTGSRRAEEPAMWTSCKTMRGFHNKAFAYPDHLDGVMEQDQSVYTDDDGDFDYDDSTTCPPSEDSEEEGRNTIGRFATRRLSQTLLKMGISHQDETKQTPATTDSSVRMTNHVSTHVSRDYMQSFVTGMVVVEVDGKPVVVVADQINQCVKAFYLDTEGRDHDWLRLCNWPSSITALSCRKQELVAVNIPFPHHIDIVRVSPRLKIVHKIKLMKEYFCLASLDSNTLVASSVWEDPPTIDILRLRWRETVTLTVIRSIVIRQSFLSLCNDPLYVNTTRRHRRILLVDWESSGLVCMDEFGSLKFKYTNDSSSNSESVQQTMQPHSVTCDSRDNIYVTDAEQNRVVQLARNGEFLRDVLTVEHGIDEPRHVAVDRRGNMYVSQFNGDVKVFSLDPPLVTRSRTLFERLGCCFYK
ncbi:uncharacterized protein LOC121377876 [Gigantopelta aegis]|uniref:uncharacterized protein LOC121377876 n=1 Tax=Gigantopelta aegis TaxID=1735272 RepID=UPI001B88B794|nr:uncharacterized protein LOC121377876 [Gigantopelta aegis]